MDALQGHLLSHGYPVSVDGDFGPRTKEVLQWFQISNGLDPDGIAGPATWAALTGDAPRMSATKSTDVGTTLLSGNVLRLVTLALGDMGKAEDPLGANYGPEIAHIFPPEMIGQPWCAGAVSSWMSRAAFPAASPIPSLWAVGAMWDHCLGTSRLLGAGMAKAGDLAFMGRSGSGSDRATRGGVPKCGRKWPEGASGRQYAPGHIGLIVRVTGDLCMTVEGNYQNRVALVTREVSELAAVGRVFW